MENTFIIKVEYEFYIKGRGTVIVGQYKGPIRVGEELVSLNGEKIKILDMELFKPCFVDKCNNIGLLISKNDCTKLELIGKVFFNTYNTSFLFCSDPLNKKKPDIDYAEEYEEAKASGFDVLLFTYEDLIEFGKVNVPLSEKNCKVIYRGWMLKPKNYECLYKKLAKKNYYLINNPEEYVNTHYLPKWYKHLEGLTPKTKWSNSAPNKEETIDILKDFGDEPVIVKDYVKSRKHEWYKSCYIENAAATDKALQVVDNFINGQGEDLNQGIVLREFVNLESIGFHEKSGMPISNEFRLFIYNYKVICTIGYWDGKGINEYPEFVNEISEKLKNVKSNFFTVDIAKKTNREWIIMELGDGQVSGLQDYEVKGFYKNLINCL
ncbi:ATP-grasp domain-containing protein [Clostridium sp. YIM B02569]|uniref:ATP-grasp domain-containing protein n=1 Tax=Clostridium sp. YIM B02569 TaxID=2911967 RepID=UPI001EEA025D|nr:ATP-grasp domain-containing protein [Clostridium sp. YIM B02569]